MAEPEEDKDVLWQIRNYMAGRNAGFHGPFGEKKIVYCDWTASGKTLEFVENFIENFVYPYYSNTHTTSTVSAEQTTRFRAEAREIIRECVNAGEEDAVIFTGSGTTGAIHKLIRALQIEGDKAKRTAVICGPFEHHSNILPWKETGAKVVRVRESDTGLVNMDDLTSKLKKYSSAGYDLICAFSAASNVTGIMTDTEEVTKLIHEYGGLSLWDYATAAPYLKIDMNSSSSGYKDAIFCSPHKFVGGVGTPGILIAKKKLFTNPVPDGCGGGTVLYVTQNIHRYVSSIEDREEGGTPDIVGAIRAGLAFQLKNVVGEDIIEYKEQHFCRKAFSVWRKNPNICILGSSSAHRLPIFSMLIRHPDSGKLLHHNYVTALLNDLYGIQVRGGCACAGPYAQDLLGMNEDMAQRFAWFLEDKRSEGDGDSYDMGGAEEPLDLMKPGFVRLNLAYFEDEETVDFILHAVDMVATHGWKLLPLYTYSLQGAEWTHRKSGNRPMRSLRDVIYDADGCHVQGRAQCLFNHANVTLNAISKEAERVFEKALEMAEPIVGDPELPLQEDQRGLIWFLFPSEAYLFLSMPVLSRLPFKHSPLPFKGRRTTFRRVKKKYQVAIMRAAEKGQCRKNLYTGSSFSDEGEERLSRQLSEEVVKLDLSTKEEEWYHLSMTSPAKDPDDAPPLKPTRNNRVLDFFNCNIL